MNLKDLAMNIIKQNPQISNNKNAQEMINVISSGDSQRGAQIANNICKSYGISTDQALKEAKSFFNIPF